MSEVGACYYCGEDTWLEDVDSHVVCLACVDSGEEEVFCEDCGVGIDPDFVAAHPTVCCVCDQIREVD